MTQDKEENNRNVTVHFESFKQDLFQEMNLESVEWDFGSWSIKGMVLCLTVKKAPHQMVTAWLTHKQIQDLVEAYMKFYKTWRKTQ